MVLVQFLVVPDNKEILILYKLPIKTVVRPQDKTDFVVKEAYTGPGIILIQISEWFKCQMNL